LFKKRLSILLSLLLIVSILTACAQTPTDSIPDIAPDSPADSVPDAEIPADPESDSPAGDTAEVPADNTETPQNTDFSFTGTDFSELLPTADVWSMNREEFDAFLLSEGWETFNSQGDMVYVGLFQGWRAYLVLATSEQTNLVTHLQVTSVFRPETDRDMLSSAIEQLTENTWHYAYAWNSYEADTDVLALAAQWLLDSRTFAVALGGTISEEGTTRLSGTTTEQICSMLADFFAADEDIIAAAFGEYYYQLPGEVYCGFDAAYSRLSGDKLTGTWNFYTTDYVSPIMGAQPQFQVYTDSPVDRPITTVR